MKLFGWVFAACSLMLVSYSGNALAENFSGIWWDSDKPGTGVFLTLSDDNTTACGTWYLYDENGKPIWFSFWGVMRDNRLQASLYKFYGPPMGQPWDSAMVHSENVGVVDITFISPDSVVMRYDLDQTSGKLNLVRFSLLSCPGSLLWDPEKSGQGMARFHYPGPDGDMSGLIWYVYDQDGNCTWYTATGHVGTHIFDLWQFTGPSLLDEWDASLVKGSRVGSAQITVQGFDLATQTPTDMKVYFNVDGVGVMEMNLHPFKCPVAVPAL
ncbi:MAG: hypothetical protein GXO58_04645 [Thermodesulfobacteria bacterium]|nr:hypothetical protein [Thermodesulfobacteriota bacterium]